MVLCPILLLLCCRYPCHDECLLYDIPTSGLQTDPSLHEFIYYMDSVVAIGKRVDPDQLASAEASLSESTVFRKS